MNSRAEALTHRHTHVRYLNACVCVL